MLEDNIREYNFAIPGNIDRHIPGIPGLWPFGSRIQIDENNQIVATWPEGTTPMVPVPTKQGEERVEQTATPIIPPVLPGEQPENHMQ